MTYAAAVAAVLATGAAASAGEWLNPDGSAANVRPGGEASDDLAGNHDIVEIPDIRTARPAPLPDRNFAQPRRVRVSIPAGHLPPPGECRLWYADRPPGHQPPPRSCSELRAKANGRAILIEG